MDTRGRQSKEWCLKVRKTEILSPIPSMNLTLAKGQQSSSWVIRLLKNNTAIYCQLRSISTTMLTLMRLCITRAKRKIIKKSSGLRRQASKSSKLPRKMHSKSFNERKMNNSVRIYPPENNSGSKNSTGLSVLREFLLSLVEILTRMNSL